MKLNQKLIELLFCFIQYWFPALAVDSIDIYTLCAQVQYKWHSLNWNAEALLLLALRKSEKYNLSFETTVRESTVGNEQSFCLNIA